MKKQSCLILALSAMALVSCGGGGSSSTSSTQPVSSSTAPIISSDTSGTSGTSATTSSSPSESSTESSATGIPVGDKFEGIVRIYFHNDTGNESTFRIYVWCDGVDGQEFDWTGSDKECGVYYDVDITQAPYAGKVTDHISFIIKKPGTWAGQSVDTHVLFTDYTSTAVAGPDGKPMLQVYSAPGEGNLIDISPDKTDVLGDSFTSFAALSDWSGFQVTGTGAIKSYRLYAFDGDYLKLNDLQRSFVVEDYMIAEAEPNSANFKITVEGGVNPQLTYRLSGVFASNPKKTKKKTASFDRLYDTAKFTTNYTYSGDDLGVTYTPEQSTFRVWAPTSSLVRLQIYDVGTPSAYSDNPAAHIWDDYPLETYWLEPQKGGVFTGTVKKDLHGYFYTYRLYYNETSYETVDPYATACGINGLRGAIVDFSKTNPEGWDQLSYKTQVNNPNELTVYEVHVRDFTADKSWVSNNGNENGTYNAFAESGTKYNGVKTGLDHLEELGVNAVQLLPVFDQDNDERTIKEVINGEEVVTKPAYNWGYNPQNYNCVEGSYSSDPFSATTRIKEFKNLILTLAKKDIRVIMDVVYNHVSSVTKHSFSTICPRYFFRYDENLNLYDDSGVGNAVHSERPMARKFIKDSLKFWAKEYKIKGFRFDLMGCLDTTTMRQAKDGVYDMGAAYHDVYMYGEGWSGDAMGAVHLSLGGKPSKSSETYQYLGDNGKGSIGCFNDAGRDGAKGNDGEDKGPEVPGVNKSDDGRKCWIFKDSTTDRVYNTLTMSIGENRWAKPADSNCDPRQTVNYLACHDNYTLYDQINYQFEYFGNKNFASGDNEWAMKACVSLSGVSLFSQGIGFLHGGDELFRQKVMLPDDPYLKAMQDSYHKGSYVHEDTGKVDTWQEGDGIAIAADNKTWLVRNSYKYGDAVNAFKWDRKANALVAKYYAKMRDLVKLRASEMGNTLGMSKIEDSKAWCWDYNDLFDEKGNSKTAIIAAAFVGQKDGKECYMLSNKGQDGTNMSIGIGNGRLEVLYSSTGRTGTFNISDNKITLEKFETLILRRVG